MAGLITDCSPAIICYPGMVYPWSKESSIPLFTERGGSNVSASCGDMSLIVNY
jgi:hypothetical protein